MLNPVSSLNPSTNITSIYNYRLQRSQRQASPETPVTPVRSPLPVYSETPNRVNLGASLFSGAYHAEQAGRSRVLAPEHAYSGPSPFTQGYEESVPGTVLPGAYPAEMAARMRVQYPGGEGAESGPELPGHDGIELDELLGADGAQQAAEEGRCQTCEERKYQDGSDDSSVSFQTPTHIDADAAPAAVRGHELEHVAHEQAKAQKEGRKVVSQTVTMHTDICPECGRVYVSGGTTRTVTKADNSGDMQTAAQGQDNKDK